MSPFRLSSRTLPRRAPGRARSPAGAGTARAAPAASVASGSHAVAVPWRVVQRGLGAIEIEHCGVEAAHSVRFALAGAGMLGLSLPKTVQPGERVRVAIRGVHAEEAAAAHDAMLVLRWFQPDGTELLWPITVE